MVARPKSIMLKIGVILALCICSAASVLNSLLSTLIIRSSCRSPFLLHNDITFNMPSTDFPTSCMLRRDLYKRVAEKTQSASYLTICHKMPDKYASDRPIHLVGTDPIPNAIAKKQKQISSSLWGVVVH